MSVNPRVRWRACGRDATGLREPPEWDETCDADRDGHSWLQQHGWVICNGRNERLVASTRVERRGEMSGLRFNGVPLAGASEGDYINVRYERRD